MDESPKPKPAIEMKQGIDGTYELSREANLLLGAIVEFEQKSSEEKAETLAELIEQAEDAEVVDELRSYEEVLREQGIRAVKEAEAADGKPESDPLLNITA